MRTVEAQLAVCSTPRSAPRRSGSTSRRRRACCAPRRSSPTGRCPGSTRRPSTASPCAASTCAPRPRSPSSCPWWARSRPGPGSRTGCSPARRCGSPPARRCRRWPTPSSRTTTHRPRPGRGHRAPRPVTVSACRRPAFVRRVGEDVPAGDVAVRRGAVRRRRPGGPAGRGRAQQGARPPAPAGLGDLGRRRARRRSTARPAPGQVADVNSLRAGRRRPGRRGRGRAPASVRRRRGAREVGRAGPLARSEIVVLAGGVGGRWGSEVQDALVGPRRPRHHPRRHAPRLRAGLRPARPGRRADVPAPREPAVARSSRSRCWCGRCIRAALGRQELHRREVSASLLSPVTSPHGRRSYLRGRLLRDAGTADYLAQPLGSSGSHLLSSLAEANCLIVIDEDATEVGLDAPGAVSLPRATRMTRVPTPWAGPVAGRHPGWPARPGPVEGARGPSSSCGPCGSARRPGVVAPSGIRDEEHLAPWEPTLAGPLGGAQRASRSGRRGGRAARDGPARARRCRSRSRGRRVRRPGR